jgi:hypothetical protein
MEKKRLGRKQESEKQEKPEIIDVEKYINLLSEEDGINKFFQEFIKLSEHNRWLVFRRMEAEFIGGIPKELLFKIMKYDSSLRERAWQLFCKVYGTSPRDLFFIIANIPELKEKAWDKFDKTFGNLINNIKSSIESRVSFYKTFNETVEAKDFKEKLKEEQNFIKEELNKTPISDDQKKEIEERLKAEGYM